MSARRDVEPRSVPKKAQGQWALGYREPLNKNEQGKKDDDPLNVRQRILDIYSKQGFDSIDPGDLRARFRWFGLYTQRQEGIPGGKTATLEPEELDAEYFMLRVRIDGGALTAQQLAVVADISSTYGRDVADVSDRQNVQLHWIRVEDVPAIWEKLEAVGLSTTEACGDCPRVMLGCPLEGVATDAVLDAGPALRATVDKYVGDPRFSNLPRKFKTSISGCASHCTNHEINDVAFVGVVGPDGTPGFDVWVGGGLSTNPRFAERLGVFVTSEEVPEVWEGVVSIFRDYGYRRSRNHARIKFLMADWGPEYFRQTLETEYLGRALPDGPAPESSPSHRDHVGVVPQVDGLVAIGATTRAGRTSGTALAGLAALAEKYGRGAGGPRVRLTAQQGVVVLDIHPDDADTVVDELRGLGYEARPSAFRRGTIACTGIEFCKLALVETKGRAEAIREEMERRLPDFDTPVTINVNGCPNSCARFQVADIGFKGMITKGADGADSEAFQVHLGGQMGTEAEFGRKFRGLKVTAAEAPDYIERVLTGYLERREGGEPFAAYVSRADEAWLL
ncbi:sulfite reductase (ferredoxin) [Jatrophihabitans endophyticus]|uniref:assimilatory sulfite reductase (ferredoxin) n=1 Tax=Jatrophihabitans endophyticus TaxID=1206085 RepID=A0A1M5L767_9ACTN|nr:nitrite/sulfite reductase [Jatrophihabitans endophyticus]SHG60851.1 sulfite reductase (ferredoxin) [Jatrophihabitans endophyticus]